MTTTPAETMLALLEALGRRVASGADVDAGSLGADAATRVEAALSSDEFDLAILEDEGVRLVDALGADDDEQEHDVTHVVTAALEARDRVEHVLLGAERVLGAAPSLSRDQQIFLVELEHLVRPLLPHLTAFNELRGARAATLLPSYRRRFWWWCEGVAIAPSAVTNLAAVAELVASFPDARAKFDVLVGAAKSLRSASAQAPAARPVPVTRLLDWVARRREGSAEGRSELHIAAASSSERLEVASTEAYEVSWRPPASVIVDVHVEPRAGAVPFARLPSGRTVPSSLVPRTVHRYTIALDAAALAEDGLVVVIPLAAGDLEIAVPPE